MGLSKPGFPNSTTGQVGKMTDLEVDGTTLVVDETNDRLGIGVADPDSTLEVLSTSTQQKWSYDADSFATLSVADSSHTTIATGEATGDLILNADDIILDSHLGKWRFKRNDTLTCLLSTTSSDGSNMIFDLQVADADFIVKGNDGGVGVTALTLDMSDAGTATFSNDVKVTGDIILDDGGSLKEAGGTAAITFDGSGHVTKIGQDSPSSDDVLTYDGAKWVASAPTVGDITGVTAGTGLSGGGSSGSVTLNVDASQTQITSVGALNAGSITSGFTSIDVGAGAITTTGTASAGTAAVAHGGTTTDAVTITGDSLTTGSLLKLTSDSSTTGNRSLLTVHNDNTAAVGVQMVHLLNDAIGGDGDPILLVESSAAETEAILELRNSHTATDKPSLLRFYRTQWNEADDMSLGSVSFQAVDSTNTKTEYATIDVIATDITDGDEAGKITFNVFAGGRAGTAAAANLFSIGGEDQAADVQCEVVVNEAGIDCDFRVEGDSVTNLLFVEASSDTVTFGGDVTIGGATPKLTIGDAGAEDTMLVFDGAAADWRVGIDDGTDVLEIGVGAAHGTTTAIGINANAQTQVLAAFGANVAGSFGTFADGDGTPSVATGNLWKNHASTQTITMFDDGIAGQVINVISTAAITYDVTSTNLIGGSTDIVTASGDVTQWFFDGTNWYLTYFMDASADHSVIGGGGGAANDVSTIIAAQVFS